MKDKIIEILESHISVRWEDEITISAEKIAQLFEPLKAENLKLKSALKSLEDEAFRVADGYPEFVHLKRAVENAQQTLEVRRGNE